MPQIPSKWISGSTRLCAGLLARGAKEKLVTEPQPAFQSDLYLLRVTTQRNTPGYKIVARYVTISAPLTARTLSRNVTRTEEVTGISDIRKCFTMA